MSDQVRYHGPSVKEDGDPDIVECEPILDSLYNTGVKSELFWYVEHRVSIYEVLQMLAVSLNLSEL